MNPGEKIRVLVVDDHPMVRIGVAAIIQATPDMTAVAQAGTGEVAVQLFENGYLRDSGDPNILWFQKSSFAAHLTRDL
jgi:hypothetical protein